VNFDPSKNLRQTRNKRQNEAHIATLS